MLLMLLPVIGVMIKKPSPKARQADTFRNHFLCFVYAMAIIFI